MKVEIIYEYEKEKGIELISASGITYEQWKELKKHLPIIEQE